MKVSIFKIMLSTGYFVLCLFTLYLSTYGDDLLRLGIRPIPILVLVMMYGYEAKKTDAHAISFFALTIMADIVVTYLQLFNIAWVLYGLSFLALTAYIKHSITKKKQKQILQFFIIFILLFLVIYIFTINSEGISYLPILFYGFSICLASAFYMTNYLNSMHLGNYLLFLAMASRIVSDAITSMVLFNGANIYYSIIGFITYAISNFLFCRGFIVSSYGTKTKRSKLRY